MREANDAKYAQIRQRHLDAIVQSMIPSISTNLQLWNAMQLEFDLQVKESRQWSVTIRNAMQKHDAKCARNLIGRNLILRTNLIFQAALGEAKSKVAPLRAALGIRHQGETIFQVTWQLQPHASLYDIRISGYD
jgi:hypothetical protein